jgi:hypothetical protein
VQAAENMGTEDFALHMTHRHQPSLGGLAELHAERLVDTEGSWRAFHARIHELNLDVGHDHGER